MPFLELSTLALISKKGNLGFYICAMYPDFLQSNIKISETASWKYVSLLFYLLPALSSQVFLLLRNWPSLLVLQQKISPNQHPISDLDSPLCDDRVYHGSAHSVSIPCDRAAKTRCQLSGYFLSAKRCQLGWNHAANGQRIARTWPTEEFQF